MIFMLAGFHFERTMGKALWQPLFAKRFGLDASQKCVDLCNRLIFRTNAKQIEGGTAKRMAGRMPALPVIDLS